MTCARRFLQQCDQLRFPQRLTTRVGSMHHSRSAAILDLVADFSSFNGGVPLPVTDFFPFSVLGASDNGYPTRNFKHRHHPTSAIPMHVVPKPGRILTSREFDALDYIMKSMFIFSGQPWTHGISCVCYVHLGRRNLT